LSFTASAILFFTSNKEYLYENGKFIVTMKEKEKQRGGFRITRLGSELREGIKEIKQLFS